MTLGEPIFLTVQNSNHPLWAPNAHHPFGSCHRSTQRFTNVIRVVMRLWIMSPWCRQLGVSKGIVRDNVPQTSLTDTQIQSNTWGWMKNCGFNGFNGVSMDHSFFWPMTLTRIQMAQGRWEDPLPHLLLQWLPVLLTSSWFSLITPQQSTVWKCIKSVLGCASQIGSVVYKCL